jgi:hypothetical protein
VSLDGLLDLIASRSYVASLESQVRSELLHRVRGAFADQNEPIRLRYVVEVFAADRA